jgi:hypothetical protein
MFTDGRTPATALTASFMATGMSSITTTEASMSAVSPAGPPESVTETNPLRLIATLPST